LPTGPFHLYVRILSCKTISQTIAKVESTIEQAFIKQLEDLKYVYRDDIRDRKALEENFRKHFQELNRVTLTDSEFDRLLNQIVTSDVFAASGTLREINSFEREDGTPLNFTLVNLKDWCKNTFEVVNQLRMNTHSSHHRFDALLLLNGVPVVQVELKTTKISPGRAVEQIVAYKNEPGNGYQNTLLCFIQLFVVSNRTDTWYFANNNKKHFRFNADERFLPIYQHADRDNVKINELDRFASTFLSKCTLARTISRYMVRVQTEQQLLVMRPYQIYAVEAINECIELNNGNGFIWHTTGSGKTLTSFKASTILKDNPNIEKCLFVVDRKDLDRQTRDEFNRFQPGCVEENYNTDTLVRRLESSNYADKVIVTTIQKLGLALDESNGRNYRERLAFLRDKRVVFIFDECHRSQFGDNHKAIKDFFPKAQLFGFTGTPIFPENASYQTVEGQQARYRTTQDLFEKSLHEYTITHAIEDGNVLRFHVDYFRPEGTNPPQPGEPITKRAVVDTILDRHDAATRNRTFNAILATASIPDAIEYYHLLKTVQAERATADTHYNPLRVACVFSPPASTLEGSAAQEVRQLAEDLLQECADNKQEPDQKRAALEAIVADYNAQFKTNHRLAEFDLYYKDVQLRIKQQQYREVNEQEKIDLTIVVDMLLTGFDARYLNTLYVDKNLKYHGLIQAFSRTNRVLNETKPFGNILDFRQQQAKVNEAIELFSGKAKQRASEIWLVDPAPRVIEQLEGAVQRLSNFMQSQGLQYRPEDVPKLQGDAARAQFVECFREVQRLTTRLNQYTDLAPAHKETIDALVPPDTLQSFRGVYLDTAQRLRDQQASKGDEAAPEVQQLDFGFVLFASAIIDFDYIMGLIASSTDPDPERREMTREQVIGLIAADAKFLDERDLITAYIRQLPTDAPLNQEEIKKGYDAYRAQAQHAEVDTLAQQHGLAPEALQSFVQEILTRYTFDGQSLTALMAPLGLGWKARAKAEVALMEDLTPVLRRRAEGRDIAGLEYYES
jgi:type I restriction enzyme R subunit